MTAQTEHDVLVLRPEAIHASPHRGTQVHESFLELVTYVRRPLIAARFAATLPIVDLRRNLTRGVRRGSR